MNGNTNGTQTPYVKLLNIRLGLGRPLSLSLHAAIDINAYGDNADEYDMTLTLLVDAHPYQQQLPFVLPGGATRVKLGMSYDWTLKPLVSIGCDAQQEEDGKFCVVDFDSANTTIKTQLTQSPLAGPFLLIVEGGTILSPQWTIGSMDITMIDPTDGAGQP